MQTNITLYTVGHSNRSLGELLGLLRDSGIQTLVDVRSYPGSRRHPQFSGDALRFALEGAAMHYHWAGRHFGGMRKPKPGSPHTALTEDGLRGYADHMDTDDFQRAAMQLVNLAGPGTCRVNVCGAFAGRLPPLFDCGLPDAAGCSRDPPDRAGRDAGPSVAGGSPS